MEDKIIECEDCIYFFEELWIERGYGIVDSEKYCSCPKRGQAVTPAYEGYCEFGEEGDTVNPRSEVFYV